MLKKNYYKLIIIFTVIFTLIFSIIIFNRRNIIIIDEEYIPLSAITELKIAIDSVGQDGILELEDKEYNLHDTTVVIEQPVTILGSGKITNGCILIKETNNVSLKNIVTEALFIKIQQSSNIYIEGCTFNNILSDIQGFISFRGICSDINILNNSFSNIKYLTSSSTYGCGIKAEIHNNEPHEITLESITIKDNHFNNIHGPAAIWIGGFNVIFNNLIIDNNEIKDTENFGIEFYKVKNNNNKNIIFNNCYVSNNNITDIGSVRTNKSGAGCGGIYNNISTPGIYVTNNTIKRVLEIGIEGYYSLVQDNYIEDTGFDQLNYPITDSAGIYDGGDNIVNNTIVNPGFYGGIHFYSNSIISDKNINGNKIINIYEEWKSNKFYREGDMVVSNENWYICTTEGTSGFKSIMGTGSIIADGTCVWNYKKPLSKIGINLNGVFGIKNIDIINNTIENVKIFASLSGFVNDVKIHDNIFSGIGTNKFLSGYGSRICKDLIIERNQIHTIGMK